MRKQVSPYGDKPDRAIAIAESFNIRQIREAIASLRANPCQRGWQKQLCLLQRAEGRRRTINKRRKKHDSRN